MMHSALESRSWLRPGRRWTSGANVCREQQQLRMERKEDPELVVHCAQSGLDSSPDHVTNRSTRHAED